MTYLTKLPIIILLFVSCTLFGQNRYGYPTDSKTGKVVYEKTLQAKGTRDVLFKRVKEFLAVRDFGRVLNTTTHTGKPLNAALVAQPVTYEDAAEGKIFGNGFFQFQYRMHDFFFVIFRYRIYVNDNEYRYVLSDFVVQEIVEPGAGARKPTEINNFPIEEFVNRRHYDKSHPVFEAAIKDLKHQLRLAIDNQL